MSRTKLHSVTCPDQDYTVRVFRDPESKEFVVRIYCSASSAYLEDADYFTEDKADAIGTAQLMAGRYKPQTH